MKDLLPFATETQKRYVEAYLLHGTYRAAAEALGVHHTTLVHALGRLQARAAQRGHSPVEDAAGIVPEGYHVKGKSTLYDAEGKVRLQWVKSNKAADQLQDIAKLIAEELDVPAAQPILVAEPEEAAVEDMLAVYPMGDPHFGMLSWHEETGHDFDLQIARRDLVKVARTLMGLVMRTKRALIVNVGDFYHCDNYAKTTSSGTPLDVDSRLPKMMRVGVAAMQELIAAALELHDEVEVINAAGNHDKMLSYMLSLILAEHYRNEPRVRIRTEPTAFHYVRFGRNLIGVTHGERTKPHDLPGIMACDRPEDWGQTKHRYWLTGHVHHDQRKEYPGCIFESFRTLAPADAWHHGQGYRSGRDMKAIVYSADRGEILRRTVGL